MQYESTQPLIADKDILELVPDMEKTYHDNSLAAVMGTTPSLKYCIKPGCEGLGSLDQNEFKCSICQLHICWYCKVTFEFAHECGEYLEQLEKTETDFDHLIK